MHSLWEQEPREYNVSVSLSTAEFTEISVTTSDFLPYDGSTVYDDYNVTNITVLLSTASGGSFVSRDSVVSSSSDLLTRVTISCVTCVVLLLIVIPLIIWRCRTFQQHTISTAADKYDDGNSTVSSSAPVIVTQRSCTCRYCANSNVAFICHYNIQLNADRDACVQATESYDARNSSLYGSRLHLVSADCNDLPEAGAKSSVKKTVSTVPSYDAECALSSPVNGIENPSYYIHDDEQPSTSYGIYNMFQPNARPSPGIQRSYRLDGNVAMAIAAEHSRSMFGFEYEPISGLGGFDDVDTDIEIIYRERTAV